MSKAEKINKSKMVREYLAANKSADTNSVVEHFKNEGLDINKNFVYQVRTHMKNKKRSSSRKISASKTSKTLKKQNSMDSLIAAKRLLQSVGGDLNQAKKSLEILSKLIS